MLIHVLYVHLHPQIALVDIYYLITTNFMRLNKDINGLGYASLRFSITNYIRKPIRLIWKVMNILTVYGVIFKRECALNYNVQINYWSKLKIKVVWNVESLHFYIDNSIERKNKLYEMFIEESQPSISLTLCCSFVYVSIYWSLNIMYVTCFDM